MRLQRTREFRFPSQERLGVGSPDPSPSRSGVSVRLSPHFGRPARSAGRFGRGASFDQTTRPAIKPTKRPPSGTLDHFPLCEDEGSMKKVVLGVTGCIGAYKAPDLVRALRKRGLRVQVILTRAAREFVSPLALATVSGEPVLEHLFADPAPDNGPGQTPGPGQTTRQTQATGPDPTGGIRHISLTEETDVFVVAPATAHVIARMALGLADDFLTTFHLAVRAPTLIAPAMNTNMLEHPATQGHLDTLRERGATIIAPGEGELACGWLGPGRLAEIPDIVAAVERALGALGAPDTATTPDPAPANTTPDTPPAAPANTAPANTAPANTPAPANTAPPTTTHKDLTARNVVIAAGPTREPLDPVRYLTNRSSGRMGAELAAAAAARGAKVTLILGPTDLEPRNGAHIVRVETAVEMRDAAFAAAATADAVIMAAAVTDFRPAFHSDTKIKSAGLRNRAGAGSIPLVRNPDILAELGAARADNPAAGPAVLVGFAAETGDPVAEARRKLRTKQCDLVVGNQVGRGRVFGLDRTQAVLVERPVGASAGDSPRVSRRKPESKRSLAEAVCDVVARRLAPGA